ncbi:MAG: hypothetical protein AAF557_12925 [Pseudomonadota bacterium]
MKKAILIVILVICGAIAAYTFYESWRLQDPAYQRERTLNTGMLDVPLDQRRVVNLDQFMAQTRPRKEGTREIVRPDGIQFVAAIKAVPEKIEVKYVYKAFEIMEVNPLPNVNHQMFLETSGGEIYAVYVWDDAVDAMNAAGVTGSQIQFAGFHVYTRAKGPAIIVDAVI